MKFLSRLSSRLPSLLLYLSPSALRAGLCSTRQPTSGCQFGGHRQAQGGLEGLAASLMAVASHIGLIAGGELLGSARLDFLVRSVRGGDQRVLPAELEIESRQDESRPTKEARGNRSQLKRKRDTQRPDHARRQ